MKQDRTRILTKAPWEAQIGYCRALRVGNQIFVTGTASVDDYGLVFAAGDAYAQAKRCLEIISHAVEKLGSGMHEVVRTRMFVTDIKLYEEFGRAHAEVFKDHPPATSMVEISALIHPDMLIEIEADLICD